MTESSEQALRIYETICATSADRPFAFQTIEQLYSEIAAWQDNNPALKQLRQASPAVQTAFVEKSVEWLKAESRERRNFRVISTLCDATQHALVASPKPLPTELILKLLIELRENGLARYYFPLDQFLAIVTRDQITMEIRAELRKLHLQYVPSPTGKIDERTLKTRNRLADLMYVEGEKQPEPGRGPWSQIVFDEVDAKDDITRSGWQGLLEHFQALKQTVPGAKWQKRARELASALGEDDVREAVQRWLALGPTPDQPAEARSPAEDSAYQKGAVWCLALSQQPQVASAIGDFGVACLRKIPMIGAVSQKVGLACVQALGLMECKEAISQLARLRSKVKYSVAQRLIAKCLHEAAERSGVTVDELEDVAVPSYSLNAEGKAELSVGDATATVSLSPEGKVTVIWRNEKGKLVKSAPAHVKKAFPKEVKRVSAFAKELEQIFQAQRYRLESALISGRKMSAEHWRQYWIEHPLLGLLGQKLIWVFSNEQGWERSGLYADGEVCDGAGAAIDLSAATHVRLWHPLASAALEVQAWREHVFNASVRQPFRQVFREFYQITDDERSTKMYSNRFGGVLMRQHQFSSLCRARGWEYRLMGAGFDGFNVPMKLLASWNMHAEFYVDLPSDRDPSLRESGLGDQSEAGINLFLGSDQVRFYRDRQEIPIEEVPAIVYSEVMRDVDLFTSVSAVGEDETWSDQGERGAGVVASEELSEISGVFALRAEMVSRILPLTPIADRCKVEQGWLHVQGNLGRYRILISWGAVLRMKEKGGDHLNIPQGFLNEVKIDLAAFPVDLDHRTEMILRKAYLLANDWEITSEELIKQLM